ncbi:MAG: hypothetical protein K8F91_12220, partial [Candidatus Obscuribacterales bacterium]|nr:hypothetical protein [Candidatus Obscuribacterales bacterium]
PAVGYHLKAISVQRRMLAQLTSADKQFSPNLETAKPDVYYLILDAFAHTDTLKDIWKYDNSEFIDFLKDKGFHIVPEAFSNYDRTTLSVPSSLNMQYLDFIPEQLGIQWCDDTLNYRLMQDNRVSRLFHKLGYKYVNVFSGWTPTEFVPTAEVNIIKNSGSYISMTLMLLTVVSGFEKYWPITLDSYAETRLVPFKYIDEIASIPGPKFVLIHSLLSHPPNIFDENGNKTQLSRATLNELAVDGYLPQIKYCQKMVKKLVTSVLERPGPKPIIIIQSDHGPLFATGANQKRFYNENMRILMALHFPDQQVEPQRLSPVNVFRLLFNTYFGTKLPLLPDRSFCGPPGDQLNQYHWKDVTNQLEFAR